MEGLRTRADVVVIGAGIVGLVVAYELARAGVPSIVVFDSGEPGQQSTGRSAGGIRRQFGSELEIRLTQAALDFYEPIFRDADFAGRFEKDGYVFLAGPEQHAQLFEAWQLQVTLGVPTQWLDRAALAERFPYLELSNLSGATLCEEDGFVDPWSIVQWLVRACRRLGVTIRKQRRVDAIDVVNGRIRSVTAGPDRVETSIVVNSAGAWAGAVGELAGVPVPVVPSPRLKLTTEPQDALPPTTPLLVDLTTGAYVRAMERRVMAGASPGTTPIGFELREDFDTVEMIAERASIRFPALRDVGISKVITGLYELTPDGLPVVGYSDQVPGFCTVAGFNGHGIMHSPPLACAAAELIAFGRPERFDVGPFAPQRFAAGAPVSRRHSSFI